MRCWHPRAENVLKQVINYEPDEVILMPLYPQYSAATSGSSINEWKDICKKNNFEVKHLQYVVIQQIIVLYRLIKKKLPKKFKI